MLCHEEHIGWFETAPETLALAYADLNQRLMCYDYKGRTSYYSMLYNFVTDHDIHLINVEDENKLNENLMWGWSAEYLNDRYNYCWIHMSCEDCVTDDGQEFKEIIFIEEPILDPGNHGEDFLLYSEGDTERNEFLASTENSKNIKKGE